GRVAAVYDLILAARFDEAALRLKDTCPPAPQPVCAALAAAALWWQILIDPASRAADEPLKRASADAVAAAQQWTAREPQRGEAWFYLAASRAPRVNLLVLRGERVAAAREGKLIKDALERALDLDPALDARYPRNPLFRERIAGLLDTHFHDRDASAAAWSKLRDRARAGGVFDAARVESRAEARERIVRSRFF